MTLNGVMAVALWFELFHWIW